jgi:hypothetical protein
LLDPSFGSGGRVVIDLSDQDLAAERGQALAEAVDKQGRVLVAGTLRETAFFNRDIGFVARLLADGSIDRSWGNGWGAGGISLVGGTSRVVAMGFDAGGRLWVTGPERSDFSGPWQYDLFDAFGGDAGFGAVDMSAFMSDFQTTVPTAMASPPMARC